MSAAGPGFDQEAMLAGLLRWVAIESPTCYAAGVNRMLDAVSADLAALGAALERQPGRDGFGDLVTARLPGRERGPGILVLAHVDTVHPVGSLAGPLRIRRDGDRVRGPGIADMKGGAFAAVWALRALVGSGRRPTLPVTVMLIPDEEVGSPSSRAAIEAEARRQRYALVPEPSQGGDLVTGRHAIARFTVRTHGRPAHAGAEPGRGRSAIREMARLIPLIEEMADPATGSTVSVGIVKGGLFVNVVATWCEAQALVMAPSEAALDDVRRKLNGLRPSHPELAIEVTPGPLRPLWRADAGTLALYELARAVAREIGLEAGHGAAGGGSDGNFTGALGIPTLDGLGLVGHGIHTPDEHIELGSLVPRARLLAGLFERLR